MSGIYKDLGSRMKSITGLDFRKQKSSLKRLILVWNTTVYWVRIVLGFLGQRGGVRVRILESRSVNSI